MSDRTVMVGGVAVPRLLYGTAWKEDRTRALTELALRQGFCGIDTANQRKHYHEAAVGEAVTAALSGGLLTRNEVFLQTKFTFRGGQDHRLPYDPAAPVADQVEQSFASSLEHLNVRHIDSYVLHGPTQRSGLAAADWEAWRAMEALHDRGGVRLLGVSNVSLEQVRQLCDGASVRPGFVQNRCYAASGWDLAVRKFCATHGMVYQGFSLLTGNRDILVHSDLTRIARRYGRTESQIVFRFALDIGMVVLTGATDAGHMREDLDVFSFQLNPDEVERIEHLSRPENIAGSRSVTPGRTSYTIPGEYGRDRVAPSGVFQASLQFSSSRYSSRAQPMPSVSTCDRWAEHQTASRASISGR